MMERIDPVMQGPVVSLARLMKLRRMSRLPTAIMLLAIRAYQFGLRPLLIGTCKFCPSCSEYAMEAVRLHGVLRGSLLAGRRLLRCHPFTPGGIDPVPPRAIHSQPKS